MARKGSIKVIVNGNRTSIQEDTGDAVKVYSPEEWAKELARRQKAAEKVDKVEGKKTEKKETRPKDGEEADDSDEDEDDGPDAKGNQDKNPPAGSTKGDVGEKANKEKETGAGNLESTTTNRSPKKGKGK